MVIYVTVSGNFTLTGHQGWPLPPGFMRLSDLAAVAVAEGLEDIGMEEVTCEEHIMKVGGGSRIKSTGGSNV